MADAKATKKMDYKHKREIAAMLDIGFGVNV